METPSEAGAWLDTFATREEAALAGIPALLKMSATTGCGQRQRTGPVEWRRDPRHASRILERLFQALAEGRRID